MKTGTFAIFATCLLGQALGAPVTNNKNADEVAVKLDGVTRMVDVEELKEALRGLGLGQASIDDLAQNAGTALTPEKRADDVTEILSLFGLKPEELDDQGLADFSNLVDSFQAKDGKINGLLEVLQPALKDTSKSLGDTTAATGSAASDVAGTAKDLTSTADLPIKRDMDAASMVFENLGINPKDLNKKTVEEVSKQLNSIAKTYDGIKTRSIKARDLPGLGSVDSIIGLVEPLTETATTVADTANKLAGGISTRGLSKRQLDAVTGLLGPLGLDTLTGVLPVKARQVQTPKGDSASEDSMTLIFDDLSDVASRLDTMNKKMPEEGDEMLQSTVDTFLKSVAKWVPAVAGSAA